MGNDAFKEKLAIAAYRRLRLIPQIENCEEPFRHCGKSVELAKAWIENSKTVIISGYAFDQVNNDVLKLSETLKNADSIYATLFNSGYATLSLAKDIFSLQKNVHLLDQYRPVFVNSEIVNPQTFNG